MGNYKYHKIYNFTTNGNLEISTKVIEEIAIQAINKVEGATLPSKRTLLFDKKPVECLFKKNGDFIMTVNIRVAYGYNVGDVSNAVQERVSQDLLYMTEIRPRKVHVNIADVK